jgi:hypothetical protein
MSGARDTELLNYIRSYGQTEASRPPCKFEHWGITVTLAETGKAIRTPSGPRGVRGVHGGDAAALSGIQVYLSRHARRGYAQGDAGVHRSLFDAIQGQSDPELSALRPQRPSPTVCHLVPQMLLQFSQGTLPGGPQDHGSALTPAPRSGIPFRPGHPTVFIASDGDQSPASPTRPTARRPKKSNEKTTPTNGHEPLRAARRQFSASPRGNQTLPE